MVAVFALVEFVAVFIVLAGLTLDELVEGFEVVGLTGLIWLVA